MRIKRQITSEIILCFLILCFAILATLTAFLNVYIFLAALVCFFLSAIILVVYSARVRLMLSKIINGGTSGLSTEHKSVLRKMNLPILMTDISRNVLWYNDIFKQKILSEGSKEILLEDICHTIPDFDALASVSPEGSEYVIGNRHYSVFTACSESSNDILYISYFIDDTEITKNSEEYLKTRPSILVIYMDNFDEIETELKGSDSAIILAEVNRSLENLINQTNGILSRVTTKQYIAVIEEQHMEGLIDNRFPILDEIRSIHTGSMPITLSIGIGRGAKTLYENHILARQALDMALGRGGDQAALKTSSGYVFYGGTSREIEKRNKVRSRIISSALMELFNEHSNVIIMGHKISDLDSLGSSIGISRAAKIAGVDVKIIIEPKTTMAKLMYERFIVEPEYQDLFISPDEALEYINNETLLIIVDCHTYNLLENPSLLEESANVVVIDHHRRMVGYIENTVLFYHEPYASSCSEMVSELLQYIETPDETPTKLEAEALLSGIMLDTKNFTVRTGVRTFDAASYLRNLGADTIVSKTFFSISMSEYLYKSGLVSTAETYKGCAIAVTDSLFENMRVVIPQTADDLLSIEGIKASIVAVKSNDTYLISARSLGEYNVQLIMEELGGGGHQMMAGAQLDDVDEETVKHLIYNAIDKYFEDNELKK